MLQPLLPDEKAAEEADNDEDHEEDNKRSEKVYCHKKIISDL